MESERKMKAKEVKGKDSKKWQKTVTGILLALIMMVSVLSLLTQATFGSDVTPTTVGMAISSSDPAHTIFPAGYEDNLSYDTSGFNDTIDEDGLRKYVVYFNDTKVYTITVRDITAGPDDDVEIDVDEKQVTFDVPAEVVIGTKFTIKGCTNIGDTVDIAVEDYVYPELNDLIIDENGEFEEEIDTATTNITSFTVPGPVILKAYIDRAAGAGEVEENETEYGSVAILMISGHLTAELSTDNVALCDDFTVNGTAIAIGLK